MGAAGVYPKQALVLVNNGGASGAEVLALARAIQADVLEKFTEQPLRQLELAKAYLESSEVTAHGPAMERVLDALAEEQIEAQRARHAATHGEKGITHG